MGPLDRALFEGDEMRAVLAARDIGTVYRHLRRLGVSQRHIAQLTGQSQSEVSEIMVRGRQVSNVWVIERIADGLGVPRAWLGVSYGEEPAEAPPAEEEVDEAVKRRALIATASTAAVGQAVGLGKTVKLALPSRQVLPSRLGISDVHVLRALTESLRGVARHYGGQAGVFGATAREYTPWLEVPAREAVKAQFAAALVELYTEAGWYCYDDGLDGTGFFTEALSLADQFGDSYGVANATWQAGLTLVWIGHPNEALKLFQFGQLRLGGFPLGRPASALPRADDPRLPTLAARLSRLSATAWALMKAPEQATRCLAEANEGWEPRDAFEHAGGDLTTAGVQLNLGQLEAAERSAANAVRGYREGHYRPGRTVAELLLAEVHVRAGEPQGLSLAHQAIEVVSTLRSAALRRERLVPLAAALAARPGTDARDLARKARQVATTRV
ncbi:MAG: helix-turn-helix transcriptional regulator [Pseudonocardiales bacterium]|nr:helix-turn-helix transcriptional regulator [Pseudonocardiales bacterium]